MPMAIKTDRMVTYNEDLPSLKSQYPFIAWSCKDTWQIEHVVYLLPHGVWPLNVVEWWLTMKGFHP